MRLRCYCSMRVTPEDNSEAQVPTTFLHAINGTLAPQKMLILGTLQHCQLTILIDSGSTHIFIDPRIIKKANVTIQLDAIFEVTMANGN